MNSINLEKPCCEVLFRFQNNTFTDTVEFQKKWFRNHNSMFWSSPEKFKLPIKDIITIALSNNREFSTFVDCFCIFGLENVRNTILNNIEYFKLDLDFYMSNFEICEKIINKMNKEENIFRDCK